MQDRIPFTYDVHAYFEEKRDTLMKWSKFLESLLPPEDGASPAPPISGAPLVEIIRTPWLEPIGTLQ